MITLKILTILLFTLVITANCHRIRNLRTVEHHSDSSDHDTSEDHKSFLGVEESAAFDKLSPEEAKIRLRKLIESKVDQDKNGLVSEVELKEWIGHIFQLTKENERNEYFSEFSENSDEPLDFDTYIKKAYSDYDENQVDEDSKKKVEAMKMLDDQKWKLADENGDNKLDKNELLAFHHPEIYPKMKPILIQEILELSDENKDGFLDLKEYLNEIWPKSEEQPEEDVIKEEKKMFKNYRDKNKDNKLDKEEIGDWLMPPNYNPIDAETRHLMQFADTNKDGNLSMAEILDSYDLFVGSQVTDYANLLKHEEL